jgi:hypothetical protein
MDFWAQRPRNGEDIIPPIYFCDSQVLPVTSNIWYDYIFSNFGSNYSTVLHPIKSIRVTRSSKNSLTSQ